MKAPSDITVRAATLSDLPAIVEIYNEGVEDGVATCDLSFTTPAERRAWFESHSGRYRIWVAVSEEDVVGWISLSPYDAKPCFSQTGTLSTYVRRSWRRKRVASALRAHLVEEAPGLGFHTLVSRIWANNPQSIAMARKFGWEQVGHMRDLVYKDGAFVDCVFFQKIL